LNDEIERLCALPVPELAAAILAAWTHRSAPRYHPVRDITSWLVSASPVRASVSGQKAVEVAEAIALLEQPACSPGALPTAADPASS
jgi:hypothetical protein